MTIQPCRCPEEFQSKQSHLIVMDDHKCPCEGQEAKCILLGHQRAAHFVLVMKESEIIHVSLAMCAMDNECQACCGT